MHRCSRRSFRDRCVRDAQLYIALRSECLSSYTRLVLAVSITAPRRLYTIYSLRFRSNDRKPPRNSTQFCARRDTASNIFG